jgi:tRNA threonylcarbamoyladenosine biosynthesis protein TsaE
MADFPNQFFGRSFISDTAAETQELAEEIGQFLASDRLYIFTLSGDLGAGKTQFVKGLARGLEIADWYYLNSPTFTLINEYHGRLPLYHFDLYRLSDTAELFELGFTDYLAPPGVLAIEWPEKAYSLLSQDNLIVVDFTIVSSTRRRLSFAGS